MTPEMKQAAAQIAAHVRTFVAREIDKATAPLISRLSRLEQKNSALQSQVAALVRDAKGK